MSFEIEGVGEYFNVSPLKSKISLSLGQYISEVLHNRNTGDVLLRSKKSGSLYLAGTTSQLQDIKSVIFNLNEDHEAGGLRLDSVIPITLNPYSLFGFVRTEVKAVVIHDQSEYGVFIDIDIEEFTSRNSKIERVLIDQYFNVVFEHSGVKQVIPASEICHIDLRKNNGLVKQIIKSVSTPKARDIILGIREIGVNRFKIIEE